MPHGPKGEKRNLAIVIHATRWCSQARARDATIRRLRARKAVPIALRLAITDTDDVSARFNTASEAPTPFAALRVALPSVPSSTARRPPLGGVAELPAVQHQQACNYRQSQQPKHPPRLRNAIHDFMGFTGIGRPEEFRTITRAHIIAWRDELAHRGLGGSTIRHRLASLASLFEYLCEKNAVTYNPVKGVERPRTESGEGKTRRRWAITRRASCSMPRKTTRSRASAIAPFSPPCCSTRCGARSYASSR